jgi:hypothetical protein
VLCYITLRLFGMWVYSDVCFYVICIFNRHFYLPLAPQLLNYINHDVSADDLLLGGASETLVHGHLLDLVELIEGFVVLSVNSSFVLRSLFFLPPFDHVHGF